MVAQRCRQVDAELAVDKKGRTSALRTQSWDVAVQIKSAIISSFDVSESDASKGGRFSPHLKEK